MKLKYFSFAIMAMAAMVSCQNEDIPQPDPVDAQVNLSVGTALGGSSLKADDTNALSGETTVNRLTALLFQEETLVAMKDTLDVADEAVLNRIGNIFVPVGTYDIIIVANADDDLLEIENLTAFKAYTGKLSSQSQSSLLMASDMLTDVELKHLTNEADEPLRLTYNYLPQQTSGVELSATSRGSSDWYVEGSNSPVELTRMVSRVQLTSVKLNFTEDLIGSSFVLKGAYLANVHPGTLLTPVDGSFETGTTYISGIVPVEGDSLIADVSEASALLAKTYDKKITGTEAVTFEDEEMFRGYVFENRTAEALPASFATRMIIAGNVVDPQGRDRGLRYYQVDIKDGELERNNIYNVELTISGLGSPTPGIKTLNAALQFALKVEDWSIIVHQEVVGDEDYK